MLIKRTIEAGKTDLFVKSGKYLSLLKCESGTRVALIHGGRKIFNSEMAQGMTLSNVEYDSIEIYSKFTQTVEIWLGNIKFNSEPQTTSRPSSFKMHDVFIGNGVAQVLPFDFQRINAKITSNKDIYYGGDNLERVSGTVKNGKLVLAGESLELKAYGVLNGSWTDEVGQVFNVGAFIPYVAWGYPSTATQLMELGVPYIDIVVPDLMAGGLLQLQWVLTIEFTEAVVQETWNPRLYITAGDPSTEVINNLGFSVTYGDHGTGLLTYAVIDNVTTQLAAGAHRIFFTDQSGVGQTVSGANTVVKVVSLEAKNAEMSAAATVTVIEERL
jgi:hypothetical protein